MQSAAPAVAQLAAEVADVDLDQVASALEVVVPHVLEDGGPGQEPAPVKAARTGDGLDVEVDDQAFRLHLPNAPAAS